jgi:UDP-N-acetyl-D-mannosaminuronate dehydrogenase
MIIERYIKQLEIAEFLRDLSLVLWDDNFNVQVSHTALRNADDIVFTVNIVKRGEKRFLFDDVKEVVQSMRNYMNSEGFVISDSTYSPSIQVCDAAGWYSAILKDDKLLSKIFGEEINHLIGVLEINFCKN